MRRALVLGLATVVLSALGVTFAVAVGTPEIDRANATFNLDPLGGFPRTTCPGEDATSYMTFRGKWKGAESETTPGFTDYNLTGSISATKAVWTVNLTTQRGVLTANVALTDPVTLTPVYQGRLTLITQGVPTQTPVVGRGWIVANTLTGGTLDGGSLLANVEISFDPALVGNATFGDAAPPFGFPNFSATTANQTC